MTSKIVVAVLGLGLTLSYCYAQNQGNKSEMVIKQLEQELEAALSKGDSAELDRILADDYIEITAQGDDKKKADVIAVARAMGKAPRGEVIGPEKTVDDLTIRLHGDSALVVGHHQSLPVYGISNLLPRFTSSPTRLDGKGNAAGSGSLVS